MSTPGRIRRVSDGVVASYIHDISARTGSGATPAPGAGQIGSLTGAGRFGGARTASTPAGTTHSHDTAHWLTFAAGAGQDRRG